MLLQLILLLQSDLGQTLKQKGGRAVWKVILSECDSAGNANLAYPFSSGSVDLSLILCPWNPFSMTAQTIFLSSGFIYQMLWSSLAVQIGSAHDQWRHM